MRKTAAIQIWPSDQIDTGKWDRCVTESPNGLIYAQSTYLRHICGNQWMGLVAGDYTAVMPLPWRRKFGLRYLYHPPFMQQLGLIGPELLPWPDLWQAIRQHFRYGDLLFNFGNTAYMQAGSIRHSNFVLPLDQPFDSLARNFRNRLKQNYKFAQNHPLEYVQASQADIPLAVNMYHELYGPKMPHITPADYEHFLLLCQTWAGSGRCLVRKVLLEDKVVASSLYLLDGKRIYNMLASSNHAGKASNAMHLLMVRFLQEMAGTNYLFDFEGSDLPGVKAFYESFGAINQPYHIRHFNELPWPLSAWKK